MARVKKKAARDLNEPKSVTSAAVQKGISPKGEQTPPARAKSDPDALSSSTHSFAKPKLTSFMSFKANAARHVMRHDESAAQVSGPKPVLGFSEVVTKEFPDSQVVDKGVPR
jgi:hypothetical protein